MNFIMKKLSQANNRSVEKYLLVRTWLYRPKKCPCFFVCAATAWLIDRISRAVGTGAEGGHPPVFGKIISTTLTRVPLEFQTFRQP